ncbi:hypothetical protein K2X30_02985 [bacterium]|nr:hypothetical protein [bacterium]
MLKRIIVILAVGVSFSPVALASDDARTWEKTGQLRGSEVSATGRQCALLDKVYDGETPRSSEHGRRISGANSADRN